MRTAVQLVVSASATVESAHGAKHPPEAAIVDAAGDRWTIVSNGLMLRNGVQAAYDLWQLLLWWDHALYAQRRADRGGEWFKRTAGTWGWEFTASSNPETGEPPPPPPPPPPANRAPVWDGSDVIFTNGQASSVNLAARASDPDGDTLAISEVAGLRPELVGAFQWNRDTFVLSYDGRDLSGAGELPLVFDTGIQLRADDGRAAATFQ